jgi:hypothetical protein
MRKLDLDNVTVKETGEQISFSAGSIYVYDDGFRKSWEVQLNNVENGKSVNEALRLSKKLNLKFETTSAIALDGDVIVKNIQSSNLGVYIHLTGTGKLNGY